MSNTGPCVHTFLYSPPILHTHVAQPPVPQPICCSMDTKAGTSPITLASVLKNTNGPHARITSGLSLLSSSARRFVQNPATPNVPSSVATWVVAKLSKSCIWYTHSLDRYPRKAVYSLSGYLQDNDFNGAMPIPPPISHTYFISSLSIKPFPIGMSTSSVSPGRTRESSFVPLPMAL